MKCYELLGDIYYSVYKIKLDKPFEIVKSIIFVADFIAEKNPEAKKKNGTAILQKHSLKYKDTVGLMSLKGLR